MKLHVNARCVQRMLALAALGTTLSLVGAPVLAAEPPTAIRCSTASSWLKPGTVPRRSGG